MDHPNIVFLVCHILISLSHTIAQSQFCSNKGTYSNNSAYSNNLNFILSIFPSNVTANGGFYNSSTGQDPDKVYALALCRGDLASDTCLDCIDSAIQGITQQCPNEKEAISWGPGISDSKCMLRYSNGNIFATVDVSPSIPVPNPNNISTNLYTFNETLYNLMGSLVTQASLGSSTLKFAVGETNYTSSDKVYALVQCTPDLSENDCRICLEGAVNDVSDCCGGKQGGRVLRPSCLVWFELYKFYDSSNIDVSSLSPPTLSNSLPPLTQVSPPPSTGKKSYTQIVIILLVLTVVLVMLITLACAILRKRKRKQNLDYDDEIKRLESLQFDFSTIRAATDDFSDANKLGQGGFGSVYKGTLPSGEEIAAKRLSGYSAQREPEFKNEILLVAKLQHRNLASLLGFCLEGTERILIYEFVGNGSLDRFIFDPIKRAQLSWETCYKIICGIARGILYLHEDSRLRIIHRDLKASNVLLDEEMNPKISDFGLARLFTMDQTQGNTCRAAGTYGYMAPEYALDGRFSVRSDVFSFGVLLLEIVSGKKNSWFSSSEDLVHLLSYAWKNWREGTVSNLIDPTLRDTSRNEIMRCIHIGLLCVQEHGANRPTMASIVLMLNSQSFSLPSPAQPGFLMCSSMEQGFPSSESNTTETVQSTNTNGTVYISVG